MVAPTWLEVMPAIPLARGVPVIFGQLGRYKGATGVMLSAGWAHISHNLGSCQDSIDGSTVMPDLDDAQGFGYALRWLQGECSHCLAFTEDRRWVDIVQRHLFGQTDDADRFFLAQACAGVLNA